MPPEASVNYLQRVAAQKCNGQGSNMQPVDRKSSNLTAGPSVTHLPILRDTRLVQQPFSRRTQVSRHQNVSTPDFIAAKDDGGGGDNWSYKTCKASVKSSPPTNQHPDFHRPRMSFLSPNQQCRSTEGNYPYYPVRKTGFLCLRSRRVEQSFVVILDGSEQGTPWHFVRDNKSSLPFGSHCLREPSVLHAHQPQLRGYLTIGAIC